MVYLRRTSFIRGLKKVGRSPLSLLNGMRDESDWVGEHMKSDFLVAVTQLAAERNLPRDMVLSAIEAALVSAYRKDSITAGQNISVTLDPGTGDVSVYIVKTVVEEVDDPLLEITVEEARKLKPDAELGQNVPTESLPHSAGRIAAQTAKQVVLQRLREAERELVYEEFADKEGDVFSVNVQRVEARQIIVDLGRAEAVLPMSEQAAGERYRPGQKMRVLLKEVERSTKGPELIVSRADDLLLKRLFEMEVPEVYNGAVEIAAISREAGFRSKVAVRARQEGVDPVGSCVGLRGVRIQSIVNELQGEKIDVVEWSRDPAKFIANALSPSQVMRVDLDEASQSAVAIVPDRLLSLAIGREGQNARLAARLTGWNVDIRSSVDADARERAAASAVPVGGDSELELLGLSTRTLNILTQAGFATVGEIGQLSKDDLLSLKSFGQKSYDEVAERLAAVLPPEPVVEAVAEVTAAEPEEPQVVEEVIEPEPAVVAEAEQVVQAEHVVAEAEEVLAEAQAAKTAETVEEQPEPQDVVAEPTAVADGAVSVGVVENPVAAPEAIPELEPEPEPEPVPVVDRSASIRDLPEDIWSIRRKSAPEPGQIRFAEDIAGLRGGVTARRGRQPGGDQGGRRRRRSRPVRRR